jgi:hypothetical protein
VSDLQQRWSGLFFIAFGALAIWAGWDLVVGTAADMGIGYTPRALAIGCIGVGCILLLQALVFPSADEGDRLRIAWRPLFLVTAMVIGFALLLPRLGLPITVALVVGAAALSGENFRWPTLAAIAAGMALLSTLLFSTALKLQIPVWPF